MPISPTSLLLRLILVATIGGIVHIQARHFVESYYSLNRTFFECRINPGIVLTISIVVGERRDRNDNDLESIWYVPFPLQSIDPNIKSTSLYLERDPYKIPLKPAIREIFEQAKSDGFA